jgi:hypothetical protein
VSQFRDVTAASWTEMTSGLTFLDMSDTTGVRWYRHGGERLQWTMYISFLGVFPVRLIIHGTGHPIRWALLIPGAVLVAAIAAWARVPLRAGIGVAPDRILIRTAIGDTSAVPWAQVTGFVGGKGSSARDSEGTVFVLTSGGERLHTAGYSAARTSAAELWQLLCALEDERLARMPGAVSTLPAPPPPPPKPGDTSAARFLVGLGVILLVAAGTLPLYFGVTQIGPGLRAASGGGIVGYYIPQRETTGRGAQWYGEFRPRRRCHPPGHRHRRCQQGDGAGWRVRGRARYRLLRRRVPPPRPGGMAPPGGHVRGGRLVLRGSPRQDHLAGDPLAATRSP